MWMSNDCVPLKNVESPYGGWVSPEYVLRQCFQLCLPCLPRGLSGVLGRLQSCGSMRPLQGILPDKILLCYTEPASADGYIYELLDSLAHTVVEGGPVGQEVKETLARLVLDHADPVGQHTVNQNTMSTLEHLPAQSEPSLGGGLVERISDGEPTACQVPDTTLDSQLMEGITYLEHLALGVSLDSGPMDGTSCLEPLEQSILQSSWIARPRNGVIKEKSEWQPVITPASSYTLDSRPMEGITYLERPALGVSLDSGPTEGAPCLEPLDQSVLSSSLAVRPVEGVTKKVSDWKPVINPVISYTLDSQLLEGITYLERSALGVSRESRPTEGAPCLEPLEQSVLSSSLAARPVEGVVEKVSDRKPVVNPVQSIDPDGRPMEWITYPEHLAPGVSLDSRLSTGMLQVKLLPSLVHKISLVARPQVEIKTSH